VSTRIRKLSSLRSAQALRERCAELECSLPLDDELEAGTGAPLAQPFEAAGRRVGNRFAVLPMEGWDATRDGRPTDLVRRRWRRFGSSGAKLVWGGEAVAVRPDGRANPHQLVMGGHSVDAIASLRAELVAAHEERFGSSEDLLVGLQLTHAGRFACPDGEPRPRIAYRHPLLDLRVGADDASILDDRALDALVDDFVAAARLAQQAGFHFVDVKHCHGYLGHELLSAVDRPGPYGGDLQGRTRFLRAVIDGIRSEAPGLEIGVRISVFDFAPFHPGPGGVGVPEVADSGGYRHAFGGDGSGTGCDLSEASALLDILEALGVRLLCTSAGSPYYCPHIQRPAFYPPSDGYRPPEDPLVGVARQIEATAELARRHPALLIVGSSYSYLQEWLPHVAQRVVREEGASAVGIGRMALSYPQLPADVLAGRPLDPRLVCRTFSDCTTAPRNGLVSGCYPLDPFYRERDEATRLAEIKRALRG
jgi:2,4-dienoyl-CoA reductase-like NADH-dependent reductase (Old Yellow Enzyme family)